MNILFWVLAVVLLVIGVILVVMPLFNRQLPDTVDGKQRNLQIARQQLADLKRQLEDGLLTQTQFDQQYQELQHNFHDDLGAIDPVATKAAGNGRWMIPVVGLLIPMLSILLYFQLGDPDAMQKAEIQQQNQQAMTKMEGMITAIIERLKKNPDDMEGWSMLGRSYLYMQKYAQAAEVFAKLHQFQPENVDVMLDYANSLAMSRNGQLNGEPSELVYKAIAMQPENHTALWLASLAKAEAGEFAAATGYLKKLAGLLPPDSGGLEQIRQLQAEIDARQSTQPDTAGTPVAANTNISVKVSMDAEVKDKVDPQQTVFIYAQALNGPKMPLAITRKQVVDLPLSLVLNDSMAMRPDMHLSNFKQLKILARVSKTGNASTQAGDFIGFTELNVSDENPSVSVVINQEVK